VRSETTATQHTPLGLLAGRPKISGQEKKDGRSQRGWLANNLPANAADVVQAVHCGGRMGKQVAPVKGRIDRPTVAAKTRLKSTYAVLFRPVPGPAQR
jgi:hypothetical protein